jgi:hypothetical protein
MGRRRRGARPPHAGFLPPRPRRPDPVARVRGHVARAPPPRRAVARRGLRRPARLHRGARRLRAHDAQAPRARTDRGAARALGRADHARRRRRRAARPTPSSARRCWPTSNGARGSRWPTRSPGPRRRRRRRSRTGAGARRPRISRKPRRAMQIPPFALERYFAEHEFSAELCCAPPTSRPTRCASCWPRRTTSDARAVGGPDPGYTETAGHPLLRAEIAALIPGARSRRLARLPRARRRRSSPLPTSRARRPTTTPSWSDAGLPVKRRGSRAPRGAGEHPRARARQSGWALDLDDVRGRCGPTRARSWSTSPAQTPTGRISTARPSTARGDRRGGRAHLFCDEVYRWLEHAARGVAAGGHRASPRGSASS